jgi:hypothetical protein
MTLKALLSSRTTESYVWVETDNFDGVKRAMLVAFPGCRLDIVMDEESKSILYMRGDEPQADGSPPPALAWAGTVIV